MKLHNINFPIYPIRKYNSIVEKDKIITIDSYHNTWILDNKNLVGDTLARRRLRIPVKERYPLNAIIFTIEQLIKYKGSTNLFVDTYGKIIKYTKTKTAAVIYRKIVKYMEPPEGGDMAIFVEKIAYPLYISKYYLKEFGAIGSNDLYAGLIKYGSNYILFELSSVNKKDTWRKI